MPVKFAINNTTSGKIEVTGLRSDAAGAGFALQYESADAAKQTLRKLGYDAEQVDKYFAALSGIGNKELLWLPEIEVTLEVLHANGFAGV